MKAKTHLLVLAVILLIPVSVLLGQKKGTSDSVKTAKGVLKIEDDTKTIDNSPVEFKSLSLDKKLVFRRVNTEGEFVSIENYFPRKNPNLIVFFVGAEAVSCIGQFFIVDVSGRKPIITERFGNCSNNPQITARNQTLTVTFPPGIAVDYYKAGNKEIWRYSNGKLKQIL